MTATIKVFGKVPQIVAHNSYWRAIAYASDSELRNPNSAVESTVLILDHRRNLRKYRNYCRGNIIAEISDQNAWNFAGQYIFPFHMYDSSSLSEGLMFTNL